MEKEPPALYTMRQGRLENQWTSNFNTTNAFVCIQQLQIQHIHCIVDIELKLTVCFSVLLIIMPLCMAEWNRILVLLSPPVSPQPSLLFQV